MAGLKKTSERGSAWLPISIPKLENLLNKAIQKRRGYQNAYALRKNIAYNLQYLEYLSRTLNDIKLTSVLTTQTWKSFILTGCGIIESLIHYLLVKKKLHSSEVWKLKIIMPGNQKTIDGDASKIDSHVYVKLARPVATEMKFETMIRKAKSNKVLGSDKSIYTKLDKLRRLRNKVHLQAIDNPTDTDWNSFQTKDLSDMAEILSVVFTSNIFGISAAEKKYFDYLHEHIET